MTQQWFEVDREGLRSLVERRGHGWLLYELIQNALDTDAYTISINTEKLPGRPKATVRVEDDSTHGFVDITHAWTMFAPSTKAADPELRGRFNVGEKLFLALAYEAKIETTTGTVTFDDSGRHRSYKDKRERGTVVEATLRLNAEQYKAMLDEVDGMLPPKGPSIWLNGKLFTYREPLRVAEKAYLQTEIANEHGQLSRTWRYTQVEFHRPRPGEKAHIFEMGLPVVETEAPFHINVMQTVPLSMDRDNVTPAYARDLYGVALDTLGDMLNETEAAAPWVNEGMPVAKPQSVIEVTQTRFGKDAVVFDPSSPESNKAAVDAGRTLVPATAFDKAGWQAIRKAREVEPTFVEPAGRAIPVGVPITPDGIGPIPEDEWTDGMKDMAAYCKAIASDVDVTLHEVEFIRVQNGSLAWFQRATSTLTFNLRTLPSGWTEAPVQIDVDALLIHELAHAKVSDHLTRAFSDECCRIGATMREKSWRRL